MNEDRLETGRKRIREQDFAGALVSLKAAWEDARGTDVPDERRSYVLREVREACRGIADACWKNGDRGTAVAALRQFLELVPGETEPFLHNKLLNRIEFLEKKTVLDSMPVRLSIALTRKCNLHCIMCYDKYRKQWELSEEVRRDLERYFPYAEYIQWRGGEVFLLEDFERLFDAAAAHPNVMQDIVTNGLLIDEAWAEKLMRTNTKISLSIDGVRKETYEYVRRGGNFETLVRNLEYLRKYKEKYRQTYRDHRLMMNFVVMKGNYRDIPQIVRFAHAYGIDYAQLVRADFGDFPPEDPFKGEDINDRTDILREIEDMMPALNEEAERLGVHFRNRLPETCSNEIYASAKKPSPGQEAERPSAEQPPAEQPKGEYCRAPWDSLFIFLFDEVKPHCFCDVAVGSARTSSLGELWNGAGMQTYRSRISGGDIGQFCSRKCLKCRPQENVGLNLY